MLNFKGQKKIFLTYKSFVYSFSFLNLPKIQHFGYYETLRKISLKATEHSPKELFFISHSSMDRTM